MSRDCCTKWFGGYLPTEPVAQIGGPKAREMERREYDAVHGDEAPPAKNSIEQLDPEKVAYWYFRLNGFLQTENFIVHPSGRGGQRTDADLLGVRFPHREEFLFDDQEPMRDDVETLDLSSDVVEIVIAEIKSNQPCSLNGPWSNRDARNVQRTLVAIGCLSDEEIEPAAVALYQEGAWKSERVRVRLVAIGRDTDPQLSKRFPRIVQITWKELLAFTGTLKWTPILGPGA